MTTAISETRRFLLITMLTAFAPVMGCAVDTDEEEEDVEEVSLPVLAGRRLSEGEVASRLRSAGFPESVVPTMVCTAKYESSFYERASNKNRNGSIDRGLFQINSIHFGRSGCPSSAEPLYDAATNTRCAYSIYRQQGLGAWYGYKAHRAECDNYRVSGGAPPPSGPPPSMNAPTGCGRLNPGQGIKQGQAVSSCNGRFRLAMQTDGNLVLYGPTGARWASSTNGRGYGLVLQGDGNLVLYTQHSAPLWNTRTQGGSTFFAVQDDGNLVVYSSAGRPLWSLR